MKEPTSEYPEELLDVFKAAALSVTKLYKTSTAAQTKARADGYQDCLDDLLALLDKGVSDIRIVRRWAVERLEGRDSIVPTVESEDEVEKTDARSSFEPQRSESCSDGGEGNEVPASAGCDSAMQTDTSSSSPSTCRVGASTASTPTTPRQQPIMPATSPNTTPKATASTAEPAYQEPVEVSVPSLDAFTFRSPINLPSESFLALANLDLSDRQLPGASGDQLPHRSADAACSASSSASPASGNPNLSSVSGTKSYRVRHAGSRHGSRSATRHGRGNITGQKRKLNFEEIFDIASLGGYGKDMFGRGNNNKRSRQS